MKPDVNEVRLNGVVYTPLDVALEVTDKALAMCSQRLTRVLEPSVGDGAFIKALLANGVKQEHITAIDIDSRAIKHLQSTYEKISAIDCDFLDYALKECDAKFDLVVGNPPFIKRVSFTNKFRERLREVSEWARFPFVDLRNAWAAFVVSASKLLNSYGVLALVIPYELMNVQYGRKIQLYLLREGFNVDVFLPDKQVFVGMAQDAVILLAHRVGAAARQITVNRVDRCSRLSVIKSAVVDCEDPKRAAIDVKATLLDGKTTELLHRLRQEMSIVENYCTSVSGIVTAANKYFILRNIDAARFDIEPWTRDILKKAEYLPDSPVFSMEDFRRVESSEPCKLVDFHLPNAPKLNKAALRYIEDGENRGLHGRYKCVRRNPWYKIPIVPSGDGLFFKRAHIFPRLCINEAEVLTTDTAYQVRMKEGYSIRDLCTSFYNSITLLFCEIDGRFYGGGVLELTPSEFKGLPLHYFATTSDGFREFVNGFPKSSVMVKPEFKDVDERVRRELHLSKEQMQRIVEALAYLRSHRRKQNDMISFNPSDRENSALVI